MLDLCRVCFILILYSWKLVADRKDHAKQLCGIVYYAPSYLIGLGFYAQSVFKITDTDRLVHTKMPILTASGTYNLQLLTMYLTYYLLDVFFFLHYDSSQVSIVVLCVFAERARFHSHFLSSCDLNAIKVFVKYCFNVLSEKPPCEHKSSPTWTCTSSWHCMSNPSDECWFHQMWKVRSAVTVVLGTLGQYVPIMTWHGLKIFTANMTSLVNLRTLSCRTDCYFFFY